MYDRMPEGKTTAQRMFLLFASLVLGGFGWFLMGESEGSSQVPVTNAVAWIGDEVITSDDIHRLAAEDLRAVEAQRREILSAAVLHEVENRLLAAEAESQGLTSEELLQHEVEDRLPPVTGEEIEAFLEENADRLALLPEAEIPGIAREEILDRHRLAARKALVSRLSSEHQVQIQSEWIGRSGALAAQGSELRQPAG